MPDPCDERPVGVPYSGRSRRRKDSRAPGSAAPLLYSKRVPSALIWCDQTDPVAAEACQAARYLPPPGRSRVEGDARQTGIGLEGSPGRSEEETDVVRLRARRPPSERPKRSPPCCPRHPCHTRAPIRRPTEFCATSGVFPLEASAMTAGGIERAVLIYETPEDPDGRHAGVLPDHEELPRRARVRRDSRRALIEGVVLDERSRSQTAARGDEPRDDVMIGGRGRLLPDDEELIDVRFPRDRRRELLSDIGGQGDLEGAADDRAEADRAALPAPTGLPARPLLPDEQIAVRRRS